MKKNLIDVKTVAQMLGIPLSGVRALIFQKRIPYVKVGRRIRFCPNSLEKWIDVNTTSETLGVKHGW